MSKLRLRQLGLAISFLVVFFLQVLLPLSFEGFWIDPFKWFMFQALLFIVLGLLIYRVFKLSGKKDNSSGTRTAANDSLEPDTLHDPDQMLGAVVHEIRTPLNKLQLVLDRADNPEIPRARETVDELSELVDNIEDVFRERDPAREWIPTVGFTRRVVQFFDDPDRLRFVTDVDWLYIDPDKMLRTVTNLIENSMEAYDEKSGSVVVRIESVGPEWCLTISDRAGGMAPDVSKVISSQNHSATSESNGMGLGLLIARRIVENHNGRMVVESNPSEGTDITLTLPKPVS